MTQAAHITRPPVVLIASDPEWTARSLESLIAPNGYAVLRAHNGRQALGLARTTQPDAIVIDQRLPDLSDCPTSAARRGACDTARCR